jgi:hypothetical protein
MAWTQDTTSGALQKDATTTRDFFDATASMPNGSLPATYRIDVEISDPAHNVKGAVRSSGDGRTLFECGIEGANVIIRRNDYGELSAALATAAHGLAANESATIRVEGTGTKIDCMIVKSSGAMVTVTHTSDTYLGHRRFGVVSSVANALVTSIRVYERTAVQATATEVLVWASDGDVWAAYDEGRVDLLAARALASGSRISMAVDADGVVVAVGGGRAKRINVAARTVEDFLPTSGALPGATDTGTTKAQIVEQFRGRLVMAGMEDLPTAIAFSAAGEGLTWDLTEQADLRAEYLGVARNVTVTEPILALTVMSNNAMLIGCLNSLFVLLGDPGDLASDIPPVSINVGCSGPHAIDNAEDGVCVLHAPEGFYKLPLGGSPVSLNASVLTEGIQFGRADRDLYRVVVIRDPARRGVHIFLTQLAELATASTHFWYDETVGGYDGSMGGFFPQTLPVRPTCAKVWRGRPVIGTKEGRWVEFDESARGVDLDGTPDEAAIDAFFHLTLVNGPTPMEDAIVRMLALELSEDSNAVQVTAYGGATAQAAYSGVRRRALHPAFTYAVHGAPMGYEVRAPAIAVKIAGDYFAFETCVAEIEFDQRMSREGWSTLAAAGQTCAPELPVTPVTPSPTNPSGTGTAVPNIGASGYTSTFRVYVRRGANPDSTGLAVVLNLSSVGGSATQTMYDDGATGGDAVAGDLIFTWRGTVTAANGTYALPFTITDAQGRSGNGTIVVTVTSTSPPPPGGGVFTAGDAESKVFSGVATE